MTDDTGPSSEALLQFFTVPVNPWTLTLSFQYFILSVDITSLSLGSRLYAAVDSRLQLLEQYWKPQ
jgi:hypothetical protein